MSHIDSQVDPTPPSTNGSGSDSDIQVDNPATGEAIGWVPCLSDSDVAAMAGRARAAQPAWGGLGFDGRAPYLRRAQQWVIDNSDRIVDMIVSETGKTREDAMLAEVAYTAAAFGFWAKMAPKYLARQKLRPSNPFLAGKSLELGYKPIGVIGVIGPWNFPLTNSFGDCIPAMAAGNTTILKPSEQTPLTSLLMLEMTRDCGFPEGVYQVATGDGSTGAALIDNVDFVMFTGSTRTGKKVMARAAETLTPVSLELGGKDPMIVLADADLERAANGAVYYSMINGGQVCTSVERVYVEAPVYDEFVAKVGQKVSALRVGKPGPAGSVDIGAIIFPPQLDIIDSHVKDAQARGARVVTGGRMGAGPGRFYEPTVLTDVDHDMACMTEETFGPTLPVMKVADAEEALRLANDSPYGLQGSIWTKDRDRAKDLAQRMEVGGVSVNDACFSYFALELPMGGVKGSGIGRRHGPDGIKKYCTTQSLLMAPRWALRRDLNMYPYRGWSSGLLSRAVKLIWGRRRKPQEPASTPT